MRRLLVFVLARQGRPVIVPRWVALVASLYCALCVALYQVGVAS